MTFLHYSLIAGLGLMVVPLLLHMLGQRQPQLVDFPALKFVRQTTREQGRSWQLRHLLLLMLRMLLVGAIALALARPRVHVATVGSVLGIVTLGVMAAIATLVAAVAMVSRRPASVRITSASIAVALWAAVGAWAVQTWISGPSVPSSDQTSPVAAVLIVDNGPTMSYRSNNQTRLEAAKDMANWVLSKLPVDSRVGLLGAAPVGSLSLDPATATTQVRLLEPRGLHVDLVERLRTALNLVLSTPLDRKEIYLITDMAQQSWSGIDEELKKLMAEHANEVLVQVIDVGVQDSANWKLGDAKCEFQTIPEGGETAIEIAVERPSEGKTEATLKMFMEEMKPAELLIGTNGQLKTSTQELVVTQNVDLSQARATVLQLRPNRKLNAGTYNFTIRLEHNDPIKLDNERFVSIQVQSMRSTLVVADDADIARFLQLTIDPRSLDASPQDPAAQGNLCEQIRYTQLGRVAVEKYAVICLYDPPPLSAPVVQRLKEHVQSGGGLMLLLGPNQVPTEDGSPLLALLPGKIAEKVSKNADDRSCFLRTVAPTHPVFSSFGQVVNDIPWNAFPVRTHWRLEGLSGSAQSLLAYSDGSGDAAVAHAIGRGQVITVTTPIPEPAGRDSWNELTTGADTWPSYFFIVGCVRALSGADQTKLNYSAGEMVMLNNDPVQWPSRYELFAADVPSRSIEAKEGMLSLGVLDQPGIYRLKGARTPPIARAVSVNVLASETELIRLGQPELSERLGASSFRFATNTDQIESSVGQVRYGRELYSLLMLFVAGLFLAEQAMSNRFYSVNFGGAKPKV